MEQTVPSSLPSMTQEATPRAYTFSYDGQTGKLFKLWIINILLSIITVGFYNFWGKTKIRRYVARSFTLENERFEYTGRARELLKGFALAFMVFFVLGLISGLSELIFGKESGANAVISLGLTFCYILLWYFGWYSSLRYRASRTTWKAIRAGLAREGRRPYITMRIKYGLLNAITLGLSVAYTDRKIWRHVMQNASFGTAPFTYNPRPDSLFATNLVCLLLVPFTLGASRLWYIGELLNYKFDGIGIAGVVSENRFRGSEHIGFVLLNWLIVLVTVGFGRPYVINRKMRYLASHITFHGVLDTDFIRQSQEMASGTSEGLDDILGIDIGFI